MLRPAKINFFSAIKENWRELFSILGSALVLFFILQWVEDMNAPQELADGRLIPSRWGFLYEFVKLAQTLVVFVFIVAFPWFLMQMTFPKTAGSFVHDGTSLSRAWSSLGASKMTAVQWVEAGMGSSTGVSWGEAIMLEARYYSALRIYFAFLFAEAIAWLAIK